MKRTMGIGLAALLALGIGCGNDEEEAQEAANEAAQQAQEAIEQAQQQAQEAAQEAQQANTPTPSGGGDSNFGTVSLNPGFMPDPHTATGVSGGGTDASTVDPGCNGWIAGTPDHLFEAGGNFGNLRVMAHSEDDTTLVIQKPDGSYACDDDSDGLNPMVVMENVAAGTYKVWVGSYEQGTNSNYTLGFSELATVTPTKLAE